MKRLLLTNPHHPTHGVCLSPRGIFKVHVLKSRLTFGLPDIWAFYEAMKSKASIYAPY